MKKVFAVLACLLVPGAAAARDADSTKVLCYKSSGSYNLLDGVALNATEATRTLTLDVGRNWGKVQVGVFLDRTAATTLDIAPEKSFDGGGTYFDYTTRSCSSGTCTVATMTETTTVSGDVLLSYEYDVRGVDLLKLVFSGTSAGGSDLISVQACGIAGE